MQVRNLKSASDVKIFLEDGDYEYKYFKLGVFDVDGVMRGKYVTTDKFHSALDHGFGFCDVVLGWDSNDKLYDNTNFTGWHSGYPDARVRIVPESCREILFEPTTLLFICEFEGEAEKICPRGVLRRVVEKATKMGFIPKCALEYEFFMFDETPSSAKEKNYQNLEPLTTGNFGYSILRSTVHSEFYEDLLHTMEFMDIPIEGIHTETGPGVIEASLAVDNALQAADKAALFKTFTKAIAQRRGYMASFMAKWSNDYPGQSGHIHISLQNKDGSAIFHDERDPHRMSDTMRHFVAGQQILMPELLAMIAPTINSYTRLIPGYWAPTEATWGVENRTCALRVIPGPPEYQHVEYRISAADVNPYLGIAAALASGLWGIEHNLELPDGIDGNAYEVELEQKFHLPTSLWDAAYALKHSPTAIELFGKEFVEHYVATREWEEREARKVVNDWQLKRYFEII